MMTMKQKIAEDRMYEVRKWKWDAKADDYVIEGEYDLTLEEAKKIFDASVVGGIHDQIDIIQEYNDDFSEKIAYKIVGFETWDKDEM